MTRTSRPARAIRALAPLGLAVSGLLLGGRDAGAQYSPSIPFNPWGSAYQAYVYPIVPNNLSLPNQARVYYGLGSDNGAFQPYDPFADFGGGLGTPFLDQGASATDIRRRLSANTGGRYIPYNSFNRLYDSEYRRQYVPNAAVDDQYYEDRQRREEFYLQALSERDPQRRAELLRQLEQANEAARRELGSTRRRDVNAPAGTAPIRPASPSARRGSATPTPPITPARAVDRPATLPARTGPTPGVTPAPADRPATAPPGPAHPSLLDEPEAPPSEVTPPPRRTGAPPTAPDREVPPPPSRRRITPQPGNPPGR